MKKGFTLIELLAVIVILAIVALIATPIILNIIKDAKEEANKRSIENYAKAVENAITKYQLSGKEIFEGNYISSENGKKISLYNDSNQIIVTLDIEYEGNEIECDTIKYSKKDLLYLNKCKIGGDYIEYQYGKTDYICVASKELTTPGVGYVKDPKDPYKLGTEYICKVNNEEQHTFYVLSVEEDKVNLIMDRNILNNGEGTTSNNINYSNKYGSIPWISSDDYKSLIVGETTCSTLSCNDKGPVTAMNFLYESTHNWTGIPNINIQYNDEKNMYGGIYTQNNITDIKDLNNNVVKSYNNLKSRLPKISELSLAGCGKYSVTSGDYCPTWLVNGLKKDSNYSETKEK